MYRLQSGSASFASEEVWGKTSNEELAMEVICKWWSSSFHLTDESVREELFAEWLFELLYGLQKGKF